jgi:hypothetical protein
MDIRHRTLGLRQHGIRCEDVHDVKAGIWKEVVLVYNKILYQHSPGKYQWEFVEIRRGGRLRTSRTHNSVW